MDYYDSIHVEVGEKSCEDGGICYAKCSSIVNEDTRLRADPGGEGKTWLLGSYKHYKNRDEQEDKWYEFMDKINEYSSQTSIGMFGDGTSTTHEGRPEEMRGDTKITDIKNSITNITGVPPTGTKVEWNRYEDQANLGCPQYYRSMKLISGDPSPSCCKYKNDEEELKVKIPNKMCRLSKATEESNAFQQLDPQEQGEIRARCDEYNVDWELIYNMSRVKFDGATWPEHPLVNQGEGKMWDFTARPGSGEEMERGIHRNGVCGDNIGTKDPLLAPERRGPGLGNGEPGNWGLNAHPILSHEFIGEIHDPMGGGVSAQSAGGEVEASGFGHGQNLLGSAHDEELSETVLDFPWWWWWWKVPEGLYYDCEDSDNEEVCELMKSGFGGDFASNLNTGYMKYNFIGNALGPADGDRGEWQDSSGSGGTLIDYDYGEYHPWVGQVEEYDDDDVGFEWGEDVPRWAICHRNEPTRSDPKPRGVYIRDILNGIEITAPDIPCKLRRHLWLQEASAAGRSGITAPDCDIIKYSHKPFVKPLSESAADSYASGGTVPSSARAPYETEEFMEAACTHDDSEYDQKRSKRERLLPRDGDGELNKFPDDDSRHGHWINLRQVLRDPDDAAEIEERNLRNLAAAEESEAIKRWQKPSSRKFQWDRNKSWGGSGPIPTSYPSETTTSTWACEYGSPDVQITIPTWNCDQSWNDGYGYNAGWKESLFSNQINTCDRVNINSDGSYHNKDSVYGHEDGDVGDGYSGHIWGYSSFDYTGHTHSFMQPIPSPARAAEINWYDAETNGALQMGMVTSFGDINNFASIGEDTRLFRTLYDDGRNPFSSTVPTPSLSQDQVTRLMYDISNRRFPIRMTRDSYGFRGDLDINLEYVSTPPSFSIGETSTPTPSDLYVLSMATMPTPNDNSAFSNVCLKSMEAYLHSQPTDGLPWPTPTTEEQINTWNEENEKHHKYLCCGFENPDKYGLNGNVDLNFCHVNYCKIDNEISRSCRDLLEEWCEDEDNFSSPKCKPRDYHLKTSNIGGILRSYNYNRKGHFEQAINYNNSETLRKDDYIRVGATVCSRNPDIFFPSESLTTSKSPDEKIKHDNLRDSCILWCSTEGTTGSRHPCIDLLDGKEGTTSTGYCGRIYKRDVEEEINTPSGIASDLHETIKKNNDICGCYWPDEFYENINKNLQHYYNYDIQTLQEENQMIYLDDYINETLDKWIASGYLTDANRFQDEINPAIRIDKIEECLNGGGGCDQASSDDWKSELNEFRSNIMNNNLPAGPRKCVYKGCQNAPVQHHKEGDDNCPLNGLIHCTQEVNVDLGLGELNVQDENQQFITIKDGIEKSEDISSGMGLYQKKSCELKRKLIDNFNPNNTWPPEVEPPSRNYLIKSIIDYIVQFFYDENNNIKKRTIFIFIVIISVPFILYFSYLFSSDNK
tara:strand:+ start:5250 stop:9518 length:4269 start_codon:yes stop_codon:yes gene_type:complete